MVLAVQHDVLRLPRPLFRCPLNIEEYFDIERKYSKPGFKTADGKFNWHCGCVASYVTGPCGFYFRKFLVNMDKFMDTDEASSNPAAKSIFEHCYSELTSCMKKHPFYYRPIFEQFNESLNDVIEQQVNVKK